MAILMDCFEAFGGHLEELGLRFNLDEVPPTILSFTFGTILTTLLGNWLFQRKRTHNILNLDNLSSGFIVLPAEIQRI